MLKQHLPELSDSLYYDALVETCDGSDQFSCTAEGAGLETWYHDVINRVGRPDQADLSRRMEKP